MLSIKKGVSIAGSQPELILGAMVVAEVYREHGCQCVVTSGREGVHSETSLHYAGAALDFGINSVSPEDRQELRDVIKHRLGRDFDVILEPTHIHLEWQPRRPE